ncbi:hypothetical protein [Lysinibacillus sphaericus]|uniref:hypothetical protein n=1 Tax=Lysinibacillus sphaericus TaxID=1421 RepID=UPI001CBB4B12|nr:hypothetical protein [Lysinibacillus sphaericus]
MKKKHWVLILILALTLTFGGVYTFVLFNPPLEIGTLGTAVGNKSVVIGIGNKGFREVKLLEVSVNNNEKPSKTKVQVSNALQGFIITDDYNNNNESKKYGFKDIEDVSIKLDTSPSATYKKLDDGTASKKDEIYGISVFHSEEINQVIIKYSYFGISFNKTVLLN